MTPHDFVPREKALFHFQAVGVKEILKRRVLMLADEMGLGKTIQAIVAMNALNKPDNLVVCPASLVENWQTELKNWGAVLRNIKVVSYNKITRNKQLYRRTYDFIVFDESHLIKNPKAQRTKVCFGLKSARKLFMTGTPVLNRPVELWPFLALADREDLGRDFFIFAKRYCKLQKVYLGRNDRKGHWDYKGAINLRELRHKLESKKLIFRRTKAEVMSQLPEKLRSIVYIKPSTELADGIRREDDIKSARREDALAKVKGATAYIKDKLDTHNKIVVFAHHRDVLEALNAEFKRSSRLLYGGMTAAAKADAIDAFKNDDATKILISSIAVGGLGINLQFTRLCIFVELDWTPANVLQAEDRLHRIGQTEKVNFVYLAVPNSYDNALVKALLSKLKTQAQLFEPITLKEILLHYDAV